MTVKQIIENITPEIRKEMETIWFTADLHQGHPKIVPICNRPVYLNKELDEYFLSQEVQDPEYKRTKDSLWKNEINKIHDEWLVKEVFNSNVKKNHTVFILGDLSLAKRAEAEKFIDRLNGNKFMIIGNHDKNVDNSTRFSQITQIKDFRFKRTGVDINISLCHYPMASWDKKPHGAWHLYGHVHGRFKNSGLSLDVGIDNPEIGWRPINLYEVCLAMAEKEKILGEGQYYDNGLDGVD
jgi:calcineurin-like phosphoesterase family protein